MVMNMTAYCVFFAFTLWETDSTPVSKLCYILLTNVVGHTGII